MIQNKNFLRTILGVCAIALIVGLNVRHTLNDYGVRDGKLHMEVLAQSTNTSDYRQYHENNPQNCTITETHTCSIELYVPYGVPYIGGYGCKVSFSYDSEAKGTSNYCRYNGISNSVCSFHVCTKNGTGTGTGTGTSTTTKK